MVEEKILNEDETPVEAIPAEAVPQEEPATELNTRLEMRLTVAKHERIKKLSNYAVREQFIPPDHRGNVTGFINWCMSLGEDVLKHHAMQRRGYL